MTLRFQNYWKGVLGDEIYIRMLLFSAGN